MIVEFDVKVIVNLSNSKSGEQKIARSEISKQTELISFL
jgi:hypothetical protein